MRRVVTALTVIGVMVVGMSPALADTGPSEPAGVLTGQTPQKAPAVPVTSSASQTLAANLVTVQAAPAAVQSAAAAITTQAQYDAASAAVQNVFSTTTKIKHKVKAVSVAPPPKPPTPVGALGTGYVWPPSCYTIKMTDSGHNFLGWTLWTNNVQLGNWCWVENLFGYWVDYTEPWHAWWVTTHWGWASCGITGELAGWNDPPFEYGAAETWMFGRVIGPGSVYCFPDPTNQASFSQETGLWVYGWGRYDYI